LNINKMKLRAFHLRQLISSRKKLEKHTIEEYAHLIWLINTSSKPHTFAAKSHRWSD